VVLEALIAARAPVDLIALAARFPLDELVHVELCARLAMELGGGAPLLHDPARLAPGPLAEARPLLRAADLVVRVFCVGEAVSIPLLRGTWRAATHPLVRAVLGRIVKDEAAHGSFGFLFLDWAADQLTAEDLRTLAVAATETAAALVCGWSPLAERKKVDARSSSVHALGWMDTDAYLALAHGSLEACVVAPLRARGIDVDYERARPVGQETPVPPSPQ
jgi:hypothetical protein